MTEETRIVEESSAAEVAVDVEAAEAETTTAPAVETGLEAAAESVSDVASEVTEEAVKETVAEAASVVEAVTEAVQEKAAEVEAIVEKAAESAVESISEKVADAVEAVAEKADEIVETVSEAVSEAVDSVTEKVSDAVENVTEAVSDAVADVTGSDEKSAEKSESDAASAEDESTDDDERRVIRLSVGQEVQGVIKRITDFGAFVDIGAGRDGLVHISELAVGRVNQVSDVVQSGQELTLWIKKLDRARNRISLTLISPDTKTIKDINDGDIVPGTVARIVPYGAFIDIGVGTDALLHVREMGNNYVAKPDDVVTLGESLDVRILAVNRRRRRIDLSLKGLRDEPEPEVAEMAEAAAALGVQENAEIVDTYEDVQVLSPMELAFKRAMEAEGVEVEASAANKRRGRRSKKNRSMQDEIIRRTLETMRE